MNKLLVILMLVVMCGAQEKPKRVQFHPERMGIVHTCTEGLDGTLYCPSGFRTRFYNPEVWNYPENEVPKQGYRPQDHEEISIEKLKQRISELEKENKELKERLGVCKISFKEQGRQTEIANQRLGLCAQVRDVLADYVNGAKVKP